jgi:hypothetical protein
VGEEVLILLIDQQRVKIGGQLGSVRQSQLFLDRREDVLQRRVVPLGADEVPRDLPHIADVRVGQRPFAAAEPSGSAQAYQLASFRRCHREPDGPEPLDLQAQVVQTRRQLHAERGLRLAAQRPGQPVTRRRHHEPLPSRISGSRLIF